MTKDYTTKKDYTKVEVLDAFTDWRELKEEQYELMMSTGFKDRNGVEIYEGDIIEHQDGEYSFLGTVQYNPFGWFVKTDEDNISFEHFADEISWIADCEVTGNIYRCLKI